MIIAFVGTYDDESETPISGTGKTNSMTGYLKNDYDKKKRIFTNYYTNFSEEVKGFQQIIDFLGDTPHPDIVVGITEMQRILNSIGSENAQILFIDNFASQLRKTDIHLYYDTQRFMNIHKRLRVHTDIILIPYKTHMDNKPCMVNTCRKDHKIYVYSHKPFKRNPIHCFFAPAVGKLYNDRQIIYDVLNIPKKKKESLKNG